MSRLTCTRAHAKKMPKTNYRCSLCCLVIMLLENLLVLEELLAGKAPSARKTPPGKAPPPGRKGPLGEKWTLGASERSKLGRIMDSTWKKETQSHDFVIQNLIYLSVYNVFLSNTWTLVQKWISNEGGLPQWSSTLHATHFSGGIIHEKRAK